MPTRRELLIAGGALALAGSAMADDAGSAPKPANMHQLLKAAIEFKAAELVLTTGAPPALRIDGELVPLKVSPLTPADVQALVFAVLDAKQKERWAKDKTLRMAFGVKDLSRYRMTVYEQRGAMAATLKPVPFKLPPLDPALAKLKGWAARAEGLHFISGKIESGRTTALAALVDHILVERKVKVVSAHDPIEFLFPHKYSYAEQLEAGADFQGPDAGAERVVGARPDVIAWDFPHNHGAALVTLAQSGVLVLATMTAADADQAIAEVTRVAPKAKALIKGLVQLDLSPAAKGKPRKLKATFAV